MKRKLIYIGFFMVCSLFPPTVNGQYSSGLDLLGGKNKKEISFEFINGFIVTKVVYGKLFNLNFLLDTGASHNILFKKSVNDLLGYSYSDTIEIAGADLESTLTALITRNVPILLTGTEMIKRDIIVLDNDYVKLEKMLGTRIDGILGGDFFKELVIDLNYEKRLLTLRNPNSYKPKKRYSKFKIELHNNKPYITGETVLEGKKDTLKYLLDTGAALPLLIHANKTSSFEIPQNAIIGNLGKGLGGDLSGYIGLTDKLQFSNFEFNNIVTSYQEINPNIIDEKSIIRDGIVGNSILSRFHVIIDYMRGILYLKPNKKFNDEFEYDKSGILLYALGPNLDQYYVKSVYPNTPAAEAGILPGDKILKIGIWPANFFSLNKLTRKLQGVNGKKIKFKVLRNKEKIKIEFELRNLLKAE